MKPRHLSRIAIVAGVALLALAPATKAHSDITVHIDIGNAPPAPHIVFHSEPHVVFVPEHHVYVVDDRYAGNYDYFRYGHYWYSFNDGYWYRAPSWHGPFLVLHPRYVPEAIYRVPGNRWKHHAVWVPPGQAKKMSHEERHEGHVHGHEPHLYGR